MLSARYLAGCSDDLVRLYSQLESDIISNIAKRLKKVTKNAREPLSYQAQILNEIGTLQSDIKNYISKYDKTSQKMIMKLFSEATQKGTENDIKAFKHGERELSENQEQVLEATAKKLHSTAIVNSNKKTREDFANGQAIKVFSGLQRLTMTIADTASADFVTKANQAYMQVSSGAFTYDEALKLSVDELAKKGVHTVEYTDSGHLIERSIEGAVRTNIVTGLNQTVAQITLDNCQDLGTNLVEVSAHLGARPDHAEWQGKIYSLNGKVYNEDGSIKYEDFYEKCHPGEPTGICGINCRHSYYPYFEGSEPMYSDGQLDELKEVKVKFDGEELTRYEAEQQLRLYERAIRKWKLRAEAEESAGLDNTEARLRIGEYQRRAQEFCNKTGLRRDYAREYVGTANGKQPRGLSESQKEKSPSGKFGGSKPEKILENTQDVYNFYHTEILENELNGVIKGKKMSFDEANGGRCNPYYKPNSPTDNNCQSAVPAFIARRNGFDIMTKPYDPKNQIMVDLANYTNLAFIDKRTGTYPQIIMPRKSSLEFFKKWCFEKMEDGKEYSVGFTFKNESGINAKNEHVMILYKKGQELYSYDPQDWSKAKGAELDLMLKGIKLQTAELYNISDCFLNKTIVESVLTKRT